jgi:predicted protein tyrosine phosphatase
MLKRTWQIMCFILCIGPIHLCYADNQMQKSSSENKQINQKSAVSNQQALAQQPLLVIDAKNKAELPQRFRTSSAQIPESHHFNTQGLKDLQAMGSAQFSALELKLVTNLSRAPITVVDLRQESHGYLNGDAISWYGADNKANHEKSNDAIETQQTELLSQLKQANKVSLNNIVAKSKKGALDTKPVSVIVKSVMSESELAHQEGLGYERFFVTDKEIPNDQEVDRFVAFANALPKGQWLYFHCRAGKGRTTTFMTMYDILRNGKQVKLEHIVERQHVLGGINLLKVLADDSPKFQLYSQRAQFIKSFYQYVVSNADNYKTSYGDWAKEQGQALNQDPKKNKG